jgi:hypothetical protein
MTVSCVGAPSSSCVPLNDLAGTPTVPPQPESNTFIANTISGFSLLDPATGAEYIPVRRSDTVPVTSTLVESMRGGDGYQVWSYFPAPPSTTTALTLVTRGGSPRLGPIPISASTPATP